jgi:hypothetical protein
VANNFDSNVSKKLMRSFLKAFQAKRVIIKAIDTRMFAGEHTPATGDTVYVKRPTDYTTIRTADGDISSSTKNSILTGQAACTVQNMFTIPVEYNTVDEALKMDQIDELITIPAAARMVTDLETDYCEFMYKNTGLHYGTPGTAIDAWSDVSGAGSLLRAMGVPDDGRNYYILNDFSGNALADAQASLTAADGLVRSAWENATLSESFGGMRVMRTNSLSTRTSSATGGDRAGAITSSVPDATYVTHKDTMVQDIAVDGFTGNFTVKAGEIVEVTGSARLNLATRKQIIGPSGSPVLWSGTVTEDATITSGAGTLKVAGPAIQEANGQYNSVATALAENDVITILGADSTVYQPALFFHQQAFAMASVRLPRLHSTDTIARTEDGIVIRLSKYADGDKNLNRIRFDILPAYGVMNPYFAGQGFGVA